MFFDSHFEMADGESGAESFNKKTLPHERNVREHIKQEEVGRLKAITSRVKEAKAEGKTITIAGDLTTRKCVGKHAVVGIHIGKEELLPLPTLSVTRETIQNVADTVAQPLEMLGAAANIPARDVYEDVDVHMFDSVSHNKQISSTLQVKYDRETAAGQVFCNAHSSLGMIDEMNTCLGCIEKHMGIQNLFRSVLVDVQYEKKHGSVLVQVVYSTHALTDREHSARTWNYHSDFIN